MKRKILIGVLAAGTVLGFGAGFGSMHHHHHRRDRMVQHLTRVCVDSAMTARDGQSAAPPDSSHGHGHFERFERDVRIRCAAEGQRHRP